MAIEQCVRRSQGVARDRSDRQTVNTIFSEDFLETPAETDLFVGVSTVVSRYGAANVFIVSKAGRKVSSRTLQWLDHQHFFEQTGFLRGRCGGRHVPCVMCLLVCDLFVSCALQQCLLWCTV
jgi:hypothetical protein